MGNSNEKNIKSGSPLKSFIPPNRNPKSRIINDMMMRAVRKIEGGNYLEEGEEFEPRTIYYDENTTQNTEPKVQQDPYEITQQLYEIGQDSNQQMSKDPNEDVEPEPIVSLSDKKKNFKNEKEAIAHNIANTRASRVGLYGELTAPRASDSRPDKFFLSTKKLASLKGGKGLTLKSPIGLDTKKKFDLKINENVEEDDYVNIPKPKSSPSNIIDEEGEGAGFGSNIEKNNSKKKLLVNCNLEKKLFRLPDKVQFLIFCYLIEDYTSLILVSSIWYYKVNELFDDYMVPVDNTFIKTYMNTVAFKRSYFSVLPFKTGSKQRIRMDRNIIAEILPPLAGKFERIRLISGKAVTFSYTYEVAHKKGVQYKATFKFDCVKRGPRHIWIYKEDIKNDFGEKLAMIQPIVPVCVGDNIKFAINFFNYSGLVDFATIDWKPPIFEMVPNIPKDIQNNFLNGIDRNRICEVEELCNEWFLYKYFDNRNKIEFNLFQPHLTLKETKCSGYERVSIKSSYIATAPGDVKFSLPRLGAHIEIYPSYEDVIAEVKRTGLFYDLENFLQLRVGDHLTFYFTRGED